MTPQQQQAAAAEFAAFWADKGDEKQETQRFWIQLLSDVLGIENPTRYIEFERRVKVETRRATSLQTHTLFIDAYIPDTKTLIEQKGAKIDLHRAYEQSDGSELTPYQQAKRYADEMPNSLRPSWIVVCNFQEFLVYDLEKPGSEPEQIFLKDLEKEHYRLQFLADAKHDYLRREEELSLQAGVLVGKLYDALIKQYYNPKDEQSLRSLNILCVRLVFCLYAEDAGLFATRTAFEDYIHSFTIDNLRDGIIKLFRALDTPLDKRDRYDTKLQPFPYVNGGLFAAENIEIPNFTDEIVDVLCNHCAPFNWSEISPTIFGAVFESTLNPDTRRKGGMHYTSVQNIHKVIDPLFMDDLNAEYQSIVETMCTSSQQRKHQQQRLHDFQQKLGSLTFLDPACGSGNFLTETYLSLRRLENKVISTLNKGEKVIGFEDFIYVKISQFYGIEINDFAVTVAKTALWIAESQMMEETERILGMNLNFLPLKTNAYIVEGNALRTDWSTLLPIDKGACPLARDGEANLFAGFTTQTDGTAHHYDYIIGNPPFVGARLMSEEQKKDVFSIFGNTKNVGNLDYVACWYKKAADLMATYCRDAARRVSTGMEHRVYTRAALVSTNSITQGEQVAILWKPLFEKFGVHIDFAWRTFRWDSESNQKAHVHCVIVGFTCRDALNASADAKNTDARSASLQRRIFNADGTIINAQNINAYLLDAPNVFAESRQHPICDVPEIGIGNKPIDGGNYLFTEEEKNEFVKKEPNAEKYFRKWLGADEFINGWYRWCLWLGDCSPTEIRTMPECLKRVQKVRELRLASKSEGTRKIADTPTRFHVENMPSTTYIIIPETSSENRAYVPIGFMSPNVFCSNAIRLIPSATLYDFGVLTSSVHMAWMRAVCGRLKSDYRYSKDIVYNNFVWPEKIENEKLKIEKTAQAILDARALYPDSSLADLYDETLMPVELRKAHRANDEAVLAAYGWASTSGHAPLSEEEIVARLFELYEKAVN
ncbi:MAG: class I SAM-dependent DNA methyltransferase [Bacteroidales bacterium]|nr:class I SAM-dependent DNA methyltransferase [Bacteroidales bacterium]